MIPEEVATILVGPASGLAEAKAAAVAVAVGSVAAATEVCPCSHAPLHRVPQMSHFGACPHRYLQQGRGQSRPSPSYSRGPFQAFRPSSDSGMLSENHVPFGLATNAIPIVVIMRLFMFVMCTTAGQWRSTQH